MRATDVSVWPLMHKVCHYGWKIDLVSLVRRFQTGVLMEEESLALNCTAAPDQNSKAPWALRKGSIIIRSPNNFLAPGLGNGISYVSQRLHWQQLKSCLLSLSSCDWIKDRSREQTIIYMSQLFTLHFSSPTWIFIIKSLLFAHHFTLLNKDISIIDIKYKIIPKTTIRNSITC